MEVSSSTSATTDLSTRNEEELFEVRHFKPQYIWDINATKLLINQYHLWPSLIGNKCTPSGAVASSTKKTTSKDKLQLKYTKGEKTDKKDGESQISEEQIALNALEWALPALLWQEQVLHLHRDQKTTLDLVNESAKDFASDELVLKKHKAESKKKRKMIESEAEVINIEGEDEDNRQNKKVKTERESDNNRRPINFGVRFVLNGVSNFFTRLYHSFFGDHTTENTNIPMEITSTLSKRDIPVDTFSKRQPLKESSCEINTVQDESTTRKIYHQNHQQLIQTPARRLSLRERVFLTIQAMNEVDYETSTLSNQQQQQQHVIRTSKYVLNGGDAYGGDYTVYKGDITSSHSIATIRIVDRDIGRPSDSFPQSHTKIPARELLAFSRVQNQVAKSAIFAFASAETNETDSDYGVKFLSFNFKAVANRM